MWQVITAEEYNSLCDCIIVVHTVTDGEMEFLTESEEHAGWLCELLNEGGEYE